MTLRGRSICCALTSVALLAGGAQAAQAGTLYVSTAGSDANSCVEPTAPCRTIGAALTKAAAAPEASTISVGPGTYEEETGALHIEDEGLEGISIVGSGNGAGGTEILGNEAHEEPVLDFDLSGGSAHVSHLLVVQPAKTGHAAIASAENLGLEDVGVFMASDNADGINQSQPGSLTYNGGTVTMQPNTNDAGIGAGAPTSLNGVTVDVTEGSESDAIEVDGAALAAQSTAVNVAPSGGSGIEVDEGPVALTGVTVNQASNDTAVFSFNPPSASYNGVTVTMSEAAGGAQAVEQIFGAATYEHLVVGGTWKGPALSLRGAAFTVADSHLSGGPETESEVVRYTQSGEGPGLLLQRTVLSDAQDATQALWAKDSNLTLDSSLVLGAKLGIDFINDSTRARQLTVASSTVDAGAPGFADEKVHDIRAFSENGGATGASVLGSVLVEPQRSDGEHASLSCNDSDAPNQAQAPTATLGAITCATGLAGNTSTAAATLFAPPPGADQLAPGTAAIDSVPAGVIVLPFGLPVSTTDVTGAPRVVDGNGDCVPVEDRGAYELQGHSVPCPPVKAVISGLKLSPSTFKAAPSGPSVAKAKFGTLIRYADSLAATTTFTVLSAAPGRRQGHSCRKPSKANRKGKPCTRTVAVGSFVHHDSAGANSLRFTGRIHGHKLASGSYRLKAVPHNSAGNGASVLRPFRVK